MYGLEVRITKKNFQKHIKILLKASIMYLSTFKVSVAAN